MAKAYIDWTCGHSDKSLLCDLMYGKNPRVADITTVLKYVRMGFGGSEMADPSTAMIIMFPCVVSLTISVGQVWRECGSEREREKRV